MRTLKVIEGAEALSIEQHSIRGSKLFVTVNLFDDPNQLTALQSLRF